MKLYIVRHGQTELNLSHVYYGVLDVGLTPTGYKQAKEIRDLLKNENFTKIYTSQLKRAKDTAQIIKNTPSITIDKRLSEMDFGKCEGLTYDEINSNYPNFWEEYKKNWSTIILPGGESYKQMFDRSREFIDFLKENHMDETIMVVSHQGFLRSFIANLLNMGIDGTWSFEFGQGMYSLITIDADATVVRKINCKDKI